jgi:hypothetical protein
LCTNLVELLNGQDITISIPFWRHWLFDYGNIAFLPIWAYRRIVILFRMAVLLLQVLKQLILFLSWAWKKKWILEGHLLLEFFLDMGFLLRVDLILILKVGGCERVLIIILGHALFVLKVIHKMLLLFNIAMAKFSIFRLILHRNLEILEVKLILD